MGLPILLALAGFTSRFFRTLTRMWRNEDTRGLVYAVLLLLLFGTIFYSSVEGWPLLDSLYFTVITLTTVGYGDFSPQTTPGKIFTIIYLLAGLGLLASFVTVLASHMEEIRQERRKTKTTSSTTEETD